MPRPTPPSPVILTVAFAAACTAAVVMASWFVTPEGASLWFPPAALLLAYLVGVGPRGALPALVVRVAASFAAPWDASFEARVLSGVVVVGVYLAAACVVRRSGAVASSTRTPRSTVALILSMAVVAPLLAAVGTIGLLELATAGGADGVLGGVLAFAVGDAVAVLTLAPLLIRVVRGQPLDRTPSVVAVAVPALVAAAVVGIAVVVLHGQGVPLHLMAIPLTVAAVWGGSGWYATTLATTAIASALTVHVAGGTTAIGTGQLQLLLLTLGATGLVVAAASDERRRVTGELRRATQQADVTFDRSLTPTLVLASATGTVVRANDAMLELLGETEEGLHGRELSTLFTTDVPHALEAVGTRALALDVRTTGGTVRGGRLTSTPLPSGIGDAEGDAVVVAQFLDMTDVWAREDALERSNASLAAFAHRVGQDLREPLDTILGFSRLLGRDQPMPDAVREDILGRVTAGAADAVRHIDDLLETARSLAERPVPVCMDELAGWLHASAAVTMAETGGALDVRLRPGRLSLPVRTLRQVLLQLLDNGFRHHAVDGRAPRVVVTSSAVHDGVIFRVEDVGGGIPVGDLEAVFHPISRGGSGLLTSRRLAEAQGGRLLAVPSSTGSCLVLHLPVADVGASTPTGGVVAPTGDRTETDEAVLAPRPLGAVYG